MSPRQYLSMSFILAVVLVSAAQAQTPKDSCAGWGYVYGDMDGDCFVNFVDYSEYAKAWGTQIGDDAYDPNCDINAGGPDGFIDVNDLVVLVNKWLMQIGPASPSGLTFGSVTPVDIQLSWTDNSSEEDGFYIYINTSDNQPAEPNYTNDANDTTLTAVGLEQLTTYYFWVTAYNSYGESPSIDGNETTTTSAAGPLIKPGNFAYRQDLSLNPALRPGVSGNVIESGDAVKVGDTYYWYFHGYQETYEISVATATDPSGTWTKYAGNPIIEVGPEPWDDGYIACAAFYEEAGMYYLFYSAAGAAAYDNAICVATATDPIGPWTKSPSNPILEDDTGLGFAAGMIYMCGVVKVDGTYYLYVTDADYTQCDFGPMYVFTSSSIYGTWTRHTEPVLSPGAEGEWDDGAFSEAEVLYYDGVFHTFYGGAEMEPGNESCKGSSTRDLVKESIGYAYSYDGFNFTKYENNPVIDRLDITHDPHVNALAEVHFIVELPYIYTFATERWETDWNDHTGCPWCEDLALNVIEIGPVVAAAYYVSPTGDDNNDGSESYPFKTIQKAANVVSAGDKVYVLAGTYREAVTMQTSGTSGEPIIFEGVGEAVISGADIVPSGWTQYSGSVYINSYDLSLGSKNQVFIDGVGGDEARWPNNTDGDPITEDGSVMDAGSKKSVIKDSAIPGGIDWTGAKVWAMCWPCWFGWSTTITDSLPDTLKYRGRDEWGMMPASEGSYFYIYGSLDALDYENEWYYDGSDLYLQIPGGGDPDSAVIEARVRDVALDFNAKNYVQLKNIDVFSGKIIMDGDNCLLYDSKVLYPAQDLATFNALEWVKGISLGGSSNTIEKCEIAYSAVTGIAASGNNNTVTNCWIHHHDLVGNYEAAILEEGGSNNVYTYNTIHDTGRDGFNFQGSTGIDISHNEIYNTSMMTDDSGSIYACCDNFGDGNIHHNWFHDGGRSDNDQYGPGLYDILVYIDDSAENIDVYYNLLGPSDGGYAILTNGNCKDIDIINNTMWDVAGHNHITWDNLTNVRVWNNVVDYFGIDEYGDPEDWCGTSIVTNYEVDAGEFKDEPNFDLRLDTGSILIDAGTALSPYTDGYNGSAPDAGCYEYDDPAFTVGHDW